MDVLALREAGISNAISVPNGATLNSNNLDYLDNCIDYFDDKTRIILAVDQDEPGQMLQRELVRRLGAEVCYLIDFNGNKDANDFLLEHGAIDMIIDRRNLKLEITNIIKTLVNNCAKKRVSS